MVLQVPSENRQCQGRGNMGGQLIPDTRSPIIIWNLTCLCVFDSIKHMYKKVNEN